jgi:uncharacterized PurR-regulated membrane protein YhhQ (DUF165 family)
MLGSLRHSRLSTRLAIYTFAYIVSITLANILASRRMIPLPFGLSTPAGVFLIAPLFSLRDKIQSDTSVRFIYGLILFSGIVSWIAGSIEGEYALSRVALAGLVAFLASEGLDTQVFTRLNRSIYARVVVSNAVGSFADSLIFITLAFGFDLPTIVGLTLVKLIISVATIPIFIQKSTIALQS